jgi:hypothetical protein
MAVVVDNALQVCCAFVIFKTPFQPCFPLITKSAAGHRARWRPKTMELLEASLQHTDILLQCLIDFIFLL